MLSELITHINLNLKSWKFLTDCEGYWSTGIATVYDANCINQEALGSDYPRKLQTQDVSSLPHSSLDFFQLYDDETGWHNNREENLVPARRRK